MTEFFCNTSENSFSQNGFQTKFNFTPPKNRDMELDHQIDILNYLCFEGMETCSENNLSKMEQSEFSKLINYRTIVIRLAEKGVAAVILSAGHGKNMIMRHLDDASTYQMLNSNIVMKINNRLAKLLNKYSKRFTEPE